MSIGKGVILWDCVIVDDVGGLDKPCRAELRLRGGVGEIRCPPTLIAVFVVSAALRLFLCLACLKHIYIHRRTRIWRHVVDLLVSFVPFWSFHGWLASP